MLVIDSLLKQLIYNETTNVPLAPNSRRMSRTLSYVLFSGDFSPRLRLVAKQSHLQIVGWELFVAGSWRGRVG